MKDIPSTVTAGLSPAARALLREAFVVKILAANPHHDPELLETRLYAAAVRYLDERTQSERAQ